MAGAAEQIRRKTRPSYSLQLRIRVPVKRTKPVEHRGLLDRGARASKSWHRQKADALRSRKVRRLTMSTSKLGPGCERIGFMPKLARRPLRIRPRIQGAATPGERTLAEFDQGGQGQQTDRQCGVVCVAVGGRQNPGLHGRKVRSNVPAQASEPAVSPARTSNATRCPPRF